MAPSGPLKVNHHIFAVSHDPAFIWKAPCTSNSIFDFESGVRPAGGLPSECFMRLPHDAQFLALQMTILLTSCVAEFKEIRKEWKQRKKEEEAQRKAEEERQRQQAAAAAQNGGGEPQGPDGTPTSTYGSRPVQLPPIGYQPAPYPAPSSGGVPQQQLPDYGTSHMYPSYQPHSPYGQPNQNIYSQCKFSSIVSQVWPLRNVGLTFSKQTVGSLLVTRRKRRAVPVAPTPS